MTVDHPLQPLAFLEHQPTSALYAPYLRPEGLLVERGSAGLSFTKVCPSHQRASLTVRDPKDLRAWACAVCILEAEDTAARLRYALLHDRLMVGIVG